MPFMENVMQVKIKTCDREFIGDYMTVTPVDGRSEATVMLSLDHGGRNREWSSITIDLGDLARALMRAGIEIDTTR